jgi:hypothetical protein
MSVKLKPAKPRRYSKNTRAMLEEYTGYIKENTKSDTNY